MGEDAESTQKLLETHSKRRGGKSRWNGRKTVLEGENGRWNAENGRGGVSPKYLLLVGEEKTLPRSSGMSKRAVKVVVMGGSAHSTHDLLAMDL